MSINGLKYPRHISSLAELKNLRMALVVSR